MKTKHLTHRITSIILSMLMLTSMLVLPQSAAVAVQASAETCLHEYTDIFIQADSQNPQGYILHVCDKCGTSYSDQYMKYENGWYYPDTLPRMISSDNSEIQYNNRYEKVQDTSPGSDWVKESVVSSEWVNSGNQYESMFPLQTSDSRVLVGQCYYHWCIPGAGKDSEANYEQTSRFAHYDWVPANEHVSVTWTGDDNGHTVYVLSWDHDHTIYCKSGDTCDGNWGTHGYRSKAWYMMYSYQDRALHETAKYVKNIGWVSTKDTAANSSKIRFKLNDNAQPLLNISSCDVSLDKNQYYYDGTAKYPSVTVKDGSKILNYGTDYTVTYSNNIDIGTASVVVAGIGTYTGTKTVNYTIVPVPKVDLSNCSIMLSQTTYTYDGSAKLPTVTVKDGYTTLYEGTDYTISYSNNVNVGTATVTIRGIGNYTGTKTATFSINEVARTNISNCTITLSKTSYTYDGAAKRPTVTVRYGNTTLYQGTDYTVAYTNNTRVGTATVTVTGIGNYTGTKTANFTINSAPKTDISGCTINLSQSSYIYDGGAKRPNVTVKRGAATLVNGTDYTVAYSNNTNVGKATVTVTGIGNYTGTKTATFIIKSPTPMKTPFTWGIDNWNFLNSSYSGDFSSGSYRSQINSTYANALKENLTSSEYQAIFVGTWYSNAWLDEKFGGSCYGMSSTTLLAKQGFLPFSSYKSGADELHDLDRPTSNTNVSSLITYYQMLQIKGVIQQQYRTVPKRSHETNINDIISLLDSNDTVLLGFRKDGWGGHAILAYDYEYGNWTKGGVSYGARIKICDPNSSSKNDENYYIYYNTRTYAWAIPAYQGITSAKGATFNYIGANIDEINQGGYLSGSTGNRSEGFIARIDAFNISENRSVAKVQAGENGSYLTMNTAAGDIEEDYSYVLVNESEGTIGYNLRDGEAAYRVTQGEPDELELAMTYENCSMIGGSKAGESVIFDKSGFIEVNGQSAEYAMAITMNDEHPTDWFTVAVKGQGADLATLKQVDNGWVVASDSLNNVEVTVNNKYDMATTTFTTEYPAALIYEIDEDTIGIAVDKDDNGTYETTLDTKTSKSNPDEVKPGDIVPTGNLGDIDGDGEITANDALTILRSSVGMAALTPEQNKLADVDGDTEITANDALAVLRYSVGLADDDSPINKPIAA